MPRVYTVDDEPSAVVKKGGSCSSVREDLKLCVLEADCIKNKKMKSKECFESGDMPQECVQLKQLLFDCKRSLLDNRLRFRGKRDY